MPRLFPWLVFLGACAVPAPAFARGCPAPAITPQGVIFVADGSGDLTATAKNLETLVCEANLPLRVERLDWSHGKLRPLSDLVKHDHHRCCGEQLAASVLAFRHDNPGGRVFLVGHSAGSAVVLAAAECLPPGSVERIILLAPAVSVSYDLRPALRVSREGIDSFFSKSDPLLGVFVYLTGTADRRWEAAAGCLGFDGQADECGEALSCKLRQYAWSKDLKELGYQGGHYSCRNVGHLRERVLPLLLTPCSVACPAAKCMSVQPAAKCVSAQSEEAPQTVLVAASVAADEARGGESVAQQVKVIGNPRLGLLAAPEKGGERLAQQKGD